MNRCVYRKDNRYCVHLFIRDVIVKINIVNSMHNFPIIVQIFKGVYK